MTDERRETEALESEVSDIIEAMLMGLTNGEVARAVVRLVLNATKAKMAIVSDWPPRCCDVAFRQINSLMPKDEP